ncbi:hypothetical protein BpHYR1_006755 [Brachionus plicatilis]|uniref:Uncharacterized protein n=1 Tax=Brachionus plicatilis TaxID=10195 RepID=A0A3M7RLA3_BRAPC|nr:hypothetical protein BpHYR1_006755 [Brachionus plicatilis]
MQQSAIFFVKKVHKSKVHFDKKEDFLFNFIFIIEIKLLSESRINLNLYLIFEKQGRVGQVNQRSPIMRKIFVLRSYEILGG